MSKIRYSVETPHGTATRTSARTYTHVITGKIANPYSSCPGREVHIGWAGSLALAEKAFRAAQNLKTSDGFLVYSDVTMTPTHLGV